ncbi:MAG: hypothetical protein LBF28_00180 [Rickettsiales bacterium]|jgi:hypothetical protein|nr:hypothetical protein [Rickettsiales bacterium]
MRARLYLWTLIALIMSGRGSVAHAQSRPDVSEFIKEILKPGNKPGVKVDTLYVKSLDDIEKYSASGYDIRKDSIFLVYFLPDPKIKFNILEEILTELGNNKIPFIYKHEYKHYLNNWLVSKLGLEIPRLVSLNIHDEISARIQYLLFCREIFIRTNSLHAAFAGTVLKEFPISPADTEIYNFPDTPALYANWLYNKDGKNMPSDSIGQKEIDVIIEMALKMMSSMFKYYRKNFLSLAETDVFENNKNYRRFILDSTALNMGKTLGYNQALKIYYTFEINGKKFGFLDLCSERTKKKLEKFIEKSMLDKTIKRGISLIETRYMEAEALRKQFCGSKIYSQIIQDAGGR